MGEVALFWYQHSIPDMLVTEIHPHEHPHRHPSTAPLNWYDRYEYIATDVDDFIIAANSPSKYMHEIETQFKVRDIMDSLSFFLSLVLASKVPKLTHYGMVLFQTRA